MTEFSAILGLHVHQDTIAAAVSPPSREKAACRGEVAHDRTSLSRLIRSLGPHGAILSRFAARQVRAATGCIGKSWRPISMAT